MADDGFLVAAGQLGPSSETLDENLERVLSLMKAAADRGVAAICFPELALSPYFCLAEPGQQAWLLERDAPELRTVREQARALGLATVLPFAERVGDLAYNSAAIIDESGALQGVYRKVHIPLPERRHFSRGEELGVYELRGVRVGSLICADRGFPEAWRVLGLRGADIVFAPYNTCADSPRIALACPDESERLPWLQDSNAVRMRASAHMNGYFVVGAGKAGVEWDRTYIGDSLVISPWGDVLARAETNGDELVVATYQPDAVAAFRSTGHYDRREPSSYADLVAVD